MCVCVCVYIYMYMYIYIYVYIIYYKDTHDIYCRSNLFCISIQPLISKSLQNVQTLAVL